MNNFELINGRDYCVKFSPEERPETWQYFVEIKVSIKEDETSTMYLYLFTEVSEPKIKELCSKLVHEYYPMCIGNYDVCIYE